MARYLLQPKCVTPKVKTQQTVLINIPLENNYWESKKFVLKRSHLYVMIDLFLFSELIQPVIEFFIIILRLGIVCCY